MDRFRWTTLREDQIQGHLAHKTPPPYDPTVALCLGTYGDPRGGGYERGTPVLTGDVLRGGQMVRVSESLTNVREDELLTGGVSRGRQMVRVSESHPGVKQQLQKEHSKARNIFARR